MKRHSNRLLIFALLLLFTFSQLYLILDSLGCRVVNSFPLWVVLLVLSTWFTTCSRRGLWIGLPLSALLLFAAYQYYGGELVPEVNDFFDRITGVYMERIAYPGQHYAYLQAASDHSLLFVFLAFLFSSYMAAAITSQSGRLTLALIGTVPFSYACLYVNLHPPIWAVLGLVLFLFLLAAGGGHYSEDSNSYLAILCSLLPVALLLGALLLIVRPSEYSYDPQEVALNRQLREVVQTADRWIGERFDSIVLPASEGGAPRESGETAPESGGNGAQLAALGSSGSLDLSRRFHEEDRERSFLTVRSSRSGSLYLRGTSYGDYTGSGWDCAGESPAGSSLGFSALAVEAAGAEENELRVRLLWDAACRYLPYFCTESGGDAFVPAGSQNSYTLRYLSFPASFDALSLPESLAEEELRYRSYAHSYYTRLPASTREALLTLCAQAGLSADMADPITAVARYVQEGSVYDLETEAYPSGDYALYFLTEARRGYCVHYATAAAALYRALGIPARVTEGFLVLAESGETVEARGADAHAWVEIYRDGVGWLPVEVTGQSGLDTNSLGTSGAEAETPPIQPSEQPLSPEATAMPLEETQTQSALPEPEPARPTQAPVGLVTQSLEAEIGGGGVSAAGGSPLWLMLLAIVLLAAAIPLWRLLRLSIRRRRFTQSDTRRAAVALYRTAREAAAFGAKLPEPVVITAEKAAFSAHEISEEELAVSREALESTLRSCYAELSFFGKLRFKYLRGLL